MHPCALYLTPRGVLLSRPRLGRMQYGSGAGPPGPQWGASGRPGPRAWAGDRPAHPASARDAPSHCAPDRILAWASRLTLGLDLSAKVRTDFRARSRPRKTSGTRNGAAGGAGAVRHRADCGYDRWFGRHTDPPWRADVRGAKRGRTCFGRVQGLYLRGSCRSSARARFKVPGSRFTVGGKCYQPIDVQKVRNLLTVNVEP